MPGQRTRFAFDEVEAANREAEHVDATSTHENAPGLAWRVLARTGSARCTPTIYLGGLETLDDVEDLVAHPGNDMIAALEIRPHYGEITHDYPVESRAKSP